VIIGHPGQLFPDMTDILHPVILGDQGRSARVDPAPGPPGLLPRARHAPRVTHEDRGFELPDVDPEQELFQSLPLSLGMKDDLQSFTPLCHFKGFFCLSDLEAMGNQAF
jgi:hypothetical protein